MSEITAVAGQLSDPAKSPDRRLRGKLGVASIVFMVVAAAAPLGVVGGVFPLGIANGNGAGFPATFLVSTVILLLFAVGFTALTPFVDDAGAFFSYIRHSLGFSVGIGFGFVALVSYVALEAGVYGLLGPAGVGVITLFGGAEIPWWAVAAVAFAVTTYLGYRNIELSSRVLGVLLTAEIAVIGVLDLVIVLRGGGDDGLSTGAVNPATVFSGSLGIGLLFAMLSYIGFEATAVFRDEARDPQRTIPRATYAALILIGTFYAVSSWALISAWGDDRAVAQATDSGGTFLADIAQTYIRTAGNDIITVLYFTSLFACILAFHNVASRYVFALSQHRVLPDALGVAHSVHGSPHKASLWISGVVAVGIAAAVVFGLDPVTQFYTWFAATTTVGFVVLLIATSVAVLVFFARDRRGYSQWRVRIAPASGLVGLGLTLALILTNLEGLATSNALGWGIVGLLIVSFVVGVVIARRVAGAAEVTPVVHS
ncbi:MULTISPECIES: APC family permease [Mycobacteriaceae]|uniref:Amino acid transporter n=1 Tax=Mycolicibacterium neoaurum VKM Ac-1815D TaxID=700508 RepID=V5XDX2_MYCNE|nr:MULTISPECIES: APC family permease [Mycobacteriaceae]AHC25896.1 amino acid transporter [Mycolicibacterium neoaurum VKM Ac-1815D]AMO06302.1 amino acid transporter [Mycolicibacterium neoaurum]AXK75351.1 amino acid permease [Mycolicibacterium neoaurum]KJQ50977.1 amino acid transporter [Mycolicibacterium neoaurum]KUM08284.1 amino acid transporter [Mycolicibacterium neoaurum]